MFTELFNLTKKPVTVFSSSDDAAPVLTAEAGSLKTLLKACLVTGYGNKDALGYQMKFETEDLSGAVFVSSDSTSGQFHLKVDNQSGDARLSVYKTMSDFDSGEKPLTVDRLYKVKAGAWRLIGHEKAFILLLNATVPHQDDTMCAYPMIFGDVPSQSKRAAPSVVFWCAYDGKQSNYYQGIGGVQSTLFYHKNGFVDLSDTKTHAYAMCQPFVTNGGNITTAACRFRYDSKSGGVLLFEPILFNFDDGVWGFLPMVMPLSNLSSQSNLAMITDTLMLARTGWYVEGGNNNDCGVPTDFWWA